MTIPRKLLTIGHSYLVPLNRRLAHELAKEGASKWKVTVVAPSYFHGSNDLGPVQFQPIGKEPCRVVSVPAYLTRLVHGFVYGLPLHRVLLEGWDLIHCWEEPFILAGRQIAGWASRNSCLVYASFQNLTKKYPPPFCWTEQSCLRRAAGWIAFGQTVADSLSSRPGYRKRPSRTIPLGVDVECFRPARAARNEMRRRLAWDEEGAPVVGFLGRFIPEKGLGLLMRVLDKCHTPWRALFVGAGPQETELRRWSERHSDRVRICVNATHDVVPAYLNAMDVLCAPSQTTPHWREQFGRMLIEAFACGVPVIGSNSGEIPYVIGDAGIVVDERDEDQWHEALESLLNSPEQRQELARRGLERVYSRYTWPLVARQHLAFFEELLVRPLP